MRGFYQMLPNAMPQWIRTYPLDAAPRTGDGIFPGEVIEVIQVRSSLQQIGLPTLSGRLIGNRTQRWYTISTVYSACIHTSTCAQLVVNEIDLASTKLVSPLSCSGGRPRHAKSYTPT